MTDHSKTDSTRGRLSLSTKRDSDDATPKLEERLHKVLAQAGLGSRRALEERISHGLVKVNGEVATLGQSVSSGDRIELDGKAFVASTLNEPARVLLYNKPEGEVTTREDPEGRPTVFEALPRIKGARWIAVGRLDIITTGLLLLTTDGELANALMHPSRAVEREYICRVHGEVPDNIVDRLARGVALDDGPAKFDEIERIGSSDSHAWFRLVVKEGRNREVRRLWESQGYQVSRLKRVRYGAIPLPRLLKRGHSEDLPAEQVAALQAELGMEGGTQVLTLQPVIGQRKARAEIHIPRADRKGSAYVNGAMADEARELRRFDHVRDDSRPPRRGAGRPGGPRPGGQARAGKPRFGGGPGRPMGMGQPGQDRGRGERPQRGDQQPTSHEHGFARPAGGGFRGRPEGARPQGARPGGHPGARPGGHPGARPGGRPGGPRPGNPPGQHRGPRPDAGGQPAGNPNAFRSWYVPEGVDTGSKQAPPRGPSKPRRGPPHRGPGGGTSFPSDHAYGHERGPQGPGQHRGGPHTGGPGRSFTPGSNSGRPSGPRPPGPGGPRGAGPGGRPGGPRPAGHHPGGNRGPRPGGGNRGPRGGQS
jgi:23S rRNA pseudouridine2605 synthase